ncbi:MAG: trypsin-like peptidase domain-containing protein [Synechococcales bacterium]|nr:trypsin-like peptidase domain-containing protein [Synechococcales bacterium]
MQRMINWRKVFQTLWQQIKRLLWAPRTQQSRSMKSPQVPFSKALSEIFFQTLVILILVMGMASGGAIASPITAAPLPSNLPLMQMGTSAAPLPLDNDNFVSRAVKRAEDAVVQINVSRQLGGGNVPDFLRPFFSGAPQGGYGRQLQGIGSGFVITPDGKVITNAHVVNRADTVSVSFADGRILPGTVLGSDPVTDVAVIQVEATNLPTVDVGDSDQVKRGQWAIAIGNPLGLQETVTVGVISATHRLSQQIGVPDKNVGFIQTDAAINPGNSGGPLLNQAGEVIGVNSAIIGGTQGLGFAIPIATAQEVALQIVEKGYADHPYIGVQMVDLTPTTRQRINAMPNNPFSVTSDRGVIVLAVNRNSPAARSGLRPGDVVQAVNGQAVTQAAEVQAAVKATGIDRPLDMQVQRENERVSLTLRTQQYPSADS